jgi:hypothetical protein
MPSIRPGAAGGEHAEEEWRYEAIHGAIRPKMAPTGRRDYRTPARAFDESRCERSGRAHERVNADARHVSVARKPIAPVRPTPRWRDFEMPAHGSRIHRSRSWHRRLLLRPDRRLRRLRTCRQCRSSRRSSCHRCRVRRLRPQLRRSPLRSIRRFPSLRSRRLRRPCPARVRNRRALRRRRNRWRRRNHRCSRWRRMRRCSGSPECTSQRRLLRTCLRRRSSRR